MNKDYSEIENNILLYKSKETIVKDHIELLKRIDKAKDKLYCWGEVLDADFQKQMLDILKEVE